MRTAPENSQTSTDDMTARVLLEQLSGLDLVNVDGDPDGLLARASKPGFGKWLAHAARTGGCTNPVLLRGEVLTVQSATGKVVERFNTDDLPDKVLYKPCGTRLASRCPACAEVYRWDTYQLIRAGLAGGKGVPESVASHPAVFVTLTAPSFGPVHTRDSGKPSPCRPRRDKPMCPHGKPLWCNHLHAEDDSRLGRPLCLGCYDHDGHVVWNHLVARLWDRTMLHVRRAMGAQSGGVIKLRYAKVAEFQRRGIVHLHALLRIDGVDDNDPQAIIPPPVWLGPDGEPIHVFTAKMLKRAVEDEAAGIALRTAAHPSKPDGWLLTWGTQLKVKIVSTGLPGGELTEQHVAGYLAKYATKSTEVAGIHAGRVSAEDIGAYANQARHANYLITACWRLGTVEGWDRLQRWAHMFGFGGHFSTKSRRYSTTLTALREARRPANRIGVSAVDSGALAQLAEDIEDETTLVIAQWHHVGHGWQTSGDAALAAMAADAARQRRPSQRMNTLD